MIDITSEIKRKLELVVNEKINNPAVAAAIVKQASDALIGANTSVPAISDGLSGTSSPEEVRALAADLLQIAPPEVYRIRASFEGSDGDDAIKDRLTSVFISSTAFRICLTVLAVGTALFGINIGFLTFDATQATRIKAEADSAVMEAKSQAENAKDAIAGAIAGIQGQMTQLLIAQVPEMQQQVVSNLTSLEQPKLSTLSDSIQSDQKTLSTQDKRISDVSQKAADAQKAIDTAKENLDAVNAQFDQLQKMITTAQDTIGSRALAGTVWFIMRRQSSLLTGCLALSLLALLVSLAALLRRRRP